MMMRRYALFDVQSSTVDYTRFGKKVYLSALAKQREPTFVAGTLQEIIYLRRLHYPSLKRTRAPFSLRGACFVSDKNVH